MKPVADVSHRTAAQRPAPLHTIFITLDFMKRMGVPVDVLLRGTGISPSDVERPNAMVTHAQEMVLFANALEATGNTAIDSRKRAANELFNRLAHENADRFHKASDIDALLPHRWQPLSAAS